MGHPNILLFNLATCTLLVIHSFTLGFQIYFYRVSYSLFITIISTSSNYCVAFESPYVLFFFFFRSSSFSQVILFYWVYIMIVPLHLPLSHCWLYFSLSSHWDSFLIIGKIQMVSKHGFAPILALTGPFKGTRRKPPALCTLNTVYCKCTKSSAYLSASSLWCDQEIQHFTGDLCCILPIFESQAVPWKAHVLLSAHPRLYSVLLFLRPLPTQQGEMPTSPLSAEAWAEAQVAQFLPARVKRKRVYSRCHIPYNGKIRGHLDHTSQRFIESLNLPLFDALSYPNSYHKDILPKL